MNTRLQSVFSLPLQDHTRQNLRSSHQSLVDYVQDPLLASEMTISREWKVEDWQIFRFDFYRRSETRNCKRTDLPVVDIVGDSLSYALVLSFLHAPGIGL